MKFALDATPLTEPTGGVARYTWQLARAVAEHFPKDQYWLLSDQSFEIPAKHALPNLHVGSAPVTVLERRWWLWGLNREMRRHGVELFHGVDFAVPYVPRRPSVMTIHDLSPWIVRPPGEVMQQESPSSGGLAASSDWQPGSARVRSRTPTMLKLGLPTMVITPSETVRCAAIARFGLADDRVVAVPLAASDDFRPTRECVGQKIPNPYFLFVGTLEPRKNIGRLIEAWRSVKAKYGIDLVLAGRVRSDFAAPAVEPGLHLLGSVPDADLPGLYSNARAVFYPSLYEGFGLPVLEAMQCGALVITSLDPAICEVTGAEQGQRPAAVHVSATNTGALQEAMCAVAEDSTAFTGIREAAIRRASHFSWRKTAERTHQVYETSINRFRFKSRRRA